MDILARCRRWQLARRDLWADPETAAGNCYVATRKFLLHLGVKPRDMHYRGKEFDSHDADYFDFEEARAFTAAFSAAVPAVGLVLYTRSGPVTQHLLSQRIWDVYLDEVYGHCCWHVWARYQGYNVDWTARQFNADADYPLIWHDNDYYAPMGRKG